MCLSSSLSLTGILWFELFTNWASCHRYFFYFNEILPSDFFFFFFWIECILFMPWGWVYLIIEMYFQTDSPKVQTSVYKDFCQVNLCDILYIARGRTANIITTRKEMVTNRHKIQFKWIIVVTRGILRSSFLKKPCFLILLMLRK